MQQGEVEVLFCDLCGTSVPQGDVEAGRAVRRQGKTVGACCLAVLREPALAAPQAQVVVAPPTASRTTSDGRGALLPVLVAVAALATTLFVDRRIAEVEKTIAARLYQQELAQKADSEVVAGMALALDSVPRRPDTDALAAAAAKADEARAEFGKRLDELAAAVAGVAKEQQAAIDYRPLFEDLRQRQVRMLEQLGAARAAAATPSAAAPPVAPAPTEPAAAPAPAAVPAATPPAFTEQAKKLASADPAVRFEGVDDLVRGKQADGVPLLLPMAKDADPFVRRLTVEGLAAWKRADVVEALLAALADGDEYVRDTAWRSLREVTGQKLAFEAAGAKDARARAVARWQDWWEKNKATFGS